MACYRDGGCGPYEMYSCSECPASKKEYLNKRKEALDIVEHLKAEAKKYGYRLVKDRPYIKLSPCVCGKKRFDLWWDAREESWFYKCENCGRKAPYSKTKYEARKFWNEMIEKELTNGN